jgi:hypothetical protein
MYSFAIPREASQIKNELILRTIGRQLLANDQRLCLGSSERVVAAFGPMIHCHEPGSMDQ